MITKRLNKSIEALDKFKELSFRASMIVLFIIGIVKILAVELSSFKDLFNFQQIRNVFPTLAIWFGAIFLLANLIYLFIHLLKRQTAKTFDLKQKLAASFIKALEDSSFNPHRLKEDSHEYKLDSETIRRTS